MIASFIGKKLRQTQAFDESGRRWPVTVFAAGPCPIVHVKTAEKDGYSAVQLGFETRKNPRKPQVGHAKKAKLESTPRFLREIRTDDVLTDATVGSLVTVDQVFQAGDKISVTGTSKGKGWAGVVKRHHFAGGPATHGQSDRERAPGSIGGTTTPGRVYKGKRMAGRMGGETVTVKGLTVMAVDRKANMLTISGLVPGAVNGIVVINRLSDRKEVVKEEKPEELQEVKQEAVEKKA